MIPDRIDTHADDANALLTDAFREKQNVAAAVAVVAKRSQALEDLLWNVIEAIRLDNAVGVWLDAYGAIVGEPRNGRTDAEYKPVIRVRILVNRSKGRAIDLINVALALDGTATYTEYYPLAWEVEIYNTQWGGGFSILLAETKEATSYGVLLTSTWPMAGVSKFSDAGGSSIPETFVDVGDTSKKFCCAIPTNPRYRGSSFFNVDDGTWDSLPAATWDGDLLSLWG